MTIVIGYVDDGAMYMASDSQSSDANYGRFDYALPKVFHKGEMLFGYAGDVRMGQLLQFKFEIPVRSETLTDLQYMHTFFIDRLSECFHKNKLEKVEDNIKGMQNNSILVGYRGTIYEIDCDYSIMILNSPFAAIGCGCDYAIGAMHILDKTKKDVHKKLTEAVETAIKYSISCGGEVKILSMSY